MVTMKYMEVKEKMTTKEFFRCKVCGDVHYGKAGPHECPTCHNIDTYKSITKEDAKKAMML